MASITTLAAAKLHLRVDGTDEDTTIQLYIDAAEAHVNNHCDMGDQPFTEYPAPVAAAVLLIVGDLYKTRESQVDKELYKNRTVEMLLMPYRNLGM